MTSEVAKITYENAINLAYGLYDSYTYMIFITTDNYIINTTEYDFDAIRINVDGTGRYNLYYLSDGANMDALVETIEYAKQMASIGIMPKDYFISLLSSIECNGTTTVNVKNYGYFLFTPIDAPIKVSSFVLLKMQ